LTDSSEHPRHDQRRRDRRRLATVAALGGVAVLLVGLLAGMTTVWMHSGHGAAAPDSQVGGDAVSAQVIEYKALSPDRIARLPQAKYDAVIPGLLPYASTDVPAASTSAYTVSTDTPIFDNAHAPVARFAFTDFAGRPTVIVPVRVDGPWALVMTPARQMLPSQADGAAPAQTAGWVRTDALHRTAALDRRVVISTGRQTVSIEDLAGVVEQSFDVGVGAPGTPTPTGVTGYLQERYLDAAQGEATYPIQLTSLHATAQDEPYQGKDGGLIGMHYFPAHNGTVSHGCVRLSQDAVMAIDALPLGTSVTIVP
jgi:lipoprotein-anchoring transpeptidase ErfK/SrfK